MSSLNSTSAVVTGAAQGIGQAIALKLASKGAGILVIDIADGTETVDQIEENGGEATYEEADITDEAQLSKAFEGHSVDVLVNNAAYYEPIARREARQPFYDMSDDEWQKVININTTGTFLVSKQAAAHLNEGGSIINIGSGTVHSGSTGFLHYVTSKAALIGMTRAMASELGERGIRVNLVTPGLTASDTSIKHSPDGLELAQEQQSIGKRLEPEHVADAVCFLAGPQSEMITGQILNVDGGRKYY